MTTLQGNHQNHKNTPNQAGGRYEFSVEPFSEDYTGRLSWSFLGNHLLRCASLHAGSCGFGYKEMWANRHVWVLSRLVIELNSMPRTSDDYTIETWVSRIYKQFTDRLFDIKAPDGSSYGYASSVWALIDIDSRQPMDLSTFSGSARMTTAAEDRQIPIKGPGRIRIKSSTPVHDRQACYSDLDINGHVNSIRYIEMILDLFPKEQFDAAIPKRIEMAYCAETYCGETLEFYLDDNGDGHYAVEIRKASGESVVKAALAFIPS